MTNLERFSAMLAKGLAAGHGLAVADGSYMSTRHSPNLVLQLGTYRTLLPTRAAKVWYKLLAMNMKSMHTTLNYKAFTLSYLQSMWSVSSTRSNQVR